MKFKFERQNCAIKTDNIKKSSCFFPIKKKDLLKEGDNY
jgi:hypothetical protein